MATETVSQTSDTIRTPTRNTDREDFIVIFFDINSFALEELSLLHNKFIFAIRNFDDDCMYKTNYFIF
jgi:hypothetical protein